MLTNLYTASFSAAFLSFVLVFFHMPLTVQWTGLLPLLLTFPRIRPVYLIPFVLIYFLFIPHLVVALLLMLIFMFSLFLGQAGDSWLTTQALLAVSSLVVAIFAVHLALYALWVVLSYLLLRAEHSGMPPAQSIQEAAVLTLVFSLPLWIAKPLLHTLGYSMGKLLSFILYPLVYLISQLVSLIPPIKQHKKPTTLKTNPLHALHHELAKHGSKTGASTQIFYTILLLLLFAAVALTVYLLWKKKKPHVTRATPKPTPTSHLIIKKTPTEKPVKTHLHPETNPYVKRIRQAFSQVYHPQEIHMTPKEWSELQNDPLSSTLVDLYQAGRYGEKADEISASQSEQLAKQIQTARLDKN